MPQGWFDGPGQTNWLLVHRTVCTSTADKDKQKQKQKHSYIDRYVRVLYWLHIRPFHSYIEWYVRALTLNPSETNRMPLVSGSKNPGSMMALAMINPSTTPIRVNTKIGSQKRFCMVSSLTWLNVTHPGMLGRFRMPLGCCCCFFCSIPPLYTFPFNFRGVPYRYTIFPGMVYFLA